MININLTDENIQNLELFADIVQKDKESMINEALEEYFISKQKKILEKSIEDENALTNLSYDEFWDDIEI